MNPDPPTPPTDVYVTFAGIFDEQVARQFFQECAGAINAKIKRIHFLIHSPGGVVGVGVTLYNYLRNLPIEIVTYNAGSVESIGTVVFLAGGKRFASKHASFIIHKTVTPLQAPYTADMLQSRMDSVNDSDSKVEAILKAHVNIPDDKWEVHSKRDLVITAQEALSFGLIHEIADFAPPAGSLLRNINL